MVETGGPAALTIRGLAAKLGVAVTAYDWHVGDKRALLDGLVERIITQIAEVEVHGRGHQARVVDIGRSLRRALLERPDLVALVHRQGRTAALFQPARRVLVRELTAAGLRGSDAALAARAILSLVIGSVLIDRQVERQPAQVGAPGALWTPEDVPDDPELLDLLMTESDEVDVFDYTLSVLVRAVIGPSTVGP